MEPIQQKLRELEIAAHTANVPMDDLINLIERQCLLAALQRNRGNVKGAAADLGISAWLVYKKQKKILRRAVAGVRQA